MLQASCMNSGTENQRFLILGGRKGSLNSLSLLSLQNGGINLSSQKHSRILMHVKQLKILKWRTRSAKL